MQEIDLPPHQWESERPKQKEPIFGPGWPFALAVVVSIFVAAYFIDGTTYGKFAGAFGSIIAFGLVFEFANALRR